MQTTVCGVPCEYEMVKADSAETLLFLHGWGGDIRSFAGAYKAASEWNVTCINFAFPKSVPSSWGIYDYAAAVKIFLDGIGVKNPIIVGHSFGGRVAIILASQGLCKGLVLTDSAGLKPRLNLRKKLRIAKYRHRVKCGKSLDGLGSKDYNNLDPEMRKVFVRIVNTHLDKLLPFVRCKTLIFWGNADRDTPVYMAKRLHRKISGSELVIVEGGHYAYVDAHYKFVTMLKSFVMD
ncbi:MAG: alpha/beta hydrolase [Clostridiales bacterium]|nr:alpha/beta hydrolase [Clostridiales bacterium]